MYLRNKQANQGLPPPPMPPPTQKNPKWSFCEGIKTLNFTPEDLLEFDRELSDTKGLDRVTLLPFAFTRMKVFPFRQMIICFITIQQYVMNSNFSKCWFERWTFPKLTSSLRNQASALSMSSLFSSPAATPFLGQSSLLGGAPLTVHASKVAALRVKSRSLVSTTSIMLGWRQRLAFSGSGVFGREASSGFPLWVPWHLRGTCSPSSALLFPAACPSNITTTLLGEAK